MPLHSKKVNLTSANISLEQIHRLRGILPEAFSEDKIDWDKLRAVLGDHIDQRIEKFGFTWAGKSNAIKNVLIPSTATLAPAKDESIKFDESENLFIEGDNLEVLKLLQKAYFEKVKMIYIDPPYNDGEDRVYHDDFAAPLQNYLQQTGQVNGNGERLQTNSETNGRYHSDWLTMMYPRLKLAWNLLRDDGVIFVSIDDNEVHHLKIILNEIFGEENFEGHIHWRRRHNQPNDPTKMIGLVAEHILVYAKNSVTLKTVGVGKVDLTGKFSNPDNDPRGDWATKPWKVGSGQSGSRYKIITPTGAELNEEWMGEEATYKSLLADNRIVFPNRGDSAPRKKYFKFEREKEGQSATNWWDCVQFGSNQEATDEVAEILGDKSIFDNPKPTKLLENIIALANIKLDDIVLDFFAGSGSTAHALLKYGVDAERKAKFILVQLPEKLHQEIKKEVKGYEFCLSINKPTSLAEITKERIRRVIKGYGDNPQPIADGFKVFKLAASNYPENNFEFDLAKSEAENKQAFIAYLAQAKQGTLLSTANDLDVVYENIIKEGFSLNSKIATAQIGKNKMYTVVDGERQLFVCLDKKLYAQAVKELTGQPYKGKLFICLDTALDDTGKANVGLNMELKTI